MSVTGLTAHDDLDAEDNLEDEYCEVEAQLHGEKMAFLRTKLMYTSLHDMINDEDVCGDEKEEELRNEISKNVMRAEMRCCLHMIPDTFKHVNQKVSPEAVYWLSQKLKKTLEDKCRNLLLFYENSSLSSYNNRTVFEARALHVGQLLEQDAHKLKLMKQESSDLSKYENDLILSCVHKMTDSAKILRGIMTKYKLGLQPEFDEAKLQNLISRCESASLKASSMILSLRKELYHKSSIPLLKGLHKELTRARDDKIEETGAIEHQLREYQTLGDEFSSIHYNEKLDKFGLKSIFYKK